MLEEEEQVKRPSSWAAALAQLPGFVGTPVPLPTPNARKTREVSLWADDREEEPA